MGFEKPKMDIIIFQVEDVICTSYEPDFTEPTDNWGKEDWDN